MVNTQDNLRANMGRHYDLAIFDMDGVLTDCKSSWSFVHQMLEVDNEPNYNAFKEGRIDEDEFIRSDIKLWNDKYPGIRIRDIAKLFRDMPLTPGIQETVACLHYSRIKCVICSGGIDLSAKMIADEYGFDDYAAVTLLTNPDGTLTGEGLRKVDLHDKGICTKELIKKFGTTKERTVSIGNSYTDIGMFRETGRRIAFNPIDKDTEKAADFIVRSKNLADVLDHILEPETPY